MKKKEKKGGQYSPCTISAILLNCCLPVSEPFFFFLFVSLYLDLWGWEGPVLIEDVVTLL